MLPGWCCIAIAALELGNGDSWCHMCAFRFHFWGRKVNWNQASHVRASSVIRVPSPSQSTSHSYLVCSIPVKWFRILTTFAGSQVYRPTMSTSYWPVTPMVGQCSPGAGFWWAARQCNNSDVSSGAFTGSSFGRYCMAVAALPFAALRVDLGGFMCWLDVGPCWLTITLKYL